MHGAVRSGPEIWKYTASSWGGGTQFSRTNRTALAGQHRASTQRISHLTQEPVCEICHTGNPRSVRKAPVGKRLSAGERAGAGPRTALVAGRGAGPAPAHAGDGAGREARSRGA